MKAIHVTQYGGPEVLEVVDVPEPLVKAWTKLPTSRQRWTRGSKRFIFRRNHL
ncbi:MAG: hypothetical protein F6K28_22135 [Microcoleus sp. SIO2G3]|nr:hypothetical protein [Microcoleus sp. SIO2G3]